MTFASNTPKVVARSRTKRKRRSQRERTYRSFTSYRTSLRNASKPGKQFPVQATKQDQMLTLLSRLLTASGWQKHSVRQLSLRTVKKLALGTFLGTLAGCVRSYRIALRFEK